MKSLLVVAEVFDVGGLETHIKGEIIELTRLGCRVHLATGQRFNRLLLPSEVASVTSHLPLGLEATLADLRETVVELRHLICEHAIDALHVHSVASFVPSLIAAELECVPAVLTLHGPASLPDSLGPLYNFLFYSMALPSASVIVAVSREVADLASAFISPEQLFVLANGVDSGIFSPAKHAAAIDARWLVVSGLDPLKVVGVVDFIIKAKAAGLSGVLLVGDGPSRGALEEQLKTHNLTDFVEFSGASADVPSLMQSASGVAGMGRVVLEGLASGKPVCLVGYDGVKGLFDRDLVSLASQSNFSGRNLRTITQDTFIEQIACLSHVDLASLRTTIEHEFSESVLWAWFLGRLKNLNTPKRTFLSDMYRVLMSHLPSEAVPLLQSHVLFEQVGKLIHSPKHFQPAVAAKYLYHRDQFRDAKLIQVIAERDGQISNLRKAVAEQECRVVDLTQAQSNLSAQLNTVLQSRSWRMTKPLRVLAGFINNRGLSTVERAALIDKVRDVRLKLPVLTWLQAKFSRSRQILSSGGLPALARAIKFKLIKRQRHRSTAYILPTLTLSPAQKGSATPCQAENILERVPHLLPDELVIIADAPFDDADGRQRGAQLARCALKTGRKVIYLYVYPTCDFDLNRHVESELDVFGLTHLSIDRTTPSGLLDLISGRATILIELPHPKILPFVHMAKSRGVRTVFELIEDWETKLGVDWFHLDILREFVAQAEVVVGTAKLLVQRLIDLGRNDAQYLPNAANEYIFDKYRTFSRPADFPLQGKRTALYFGSLSGEWFAWEYVAAVAEQNANLDILLIGDNPGKKDLPTNAYFLGPRKIDELPNYLMHADVAILPIVPGKNSDAVSPINVFEYLFAGKPVVSTRLPEILDYPGVFIADSPEHFAELCATVIGTVPLVKQNDIFISQNSWFHRLDKIIGRQASRTFKGTVSAIILIHNNKNLIGRCLETLISHGEHYLREIIVVDNASSDGGAEFVERAFPSIRVLRNTVNGCSSGRNLGASVAQGKYLAFFDSDQWFTCSIFFDEALSLLERDARVGVIGWSAGWFDRADSDLGGMIADYCPNRAMNDAALMHGYRSDIGFLGTSGFFLPKSVFNNTDGFDTYYDPTCFEDTDLSFQIKKIGFNVCYRDLTGIRHQPHQTTRANSQSNSYTKLFRRNSAYFKKKWADHLDFFVDYPG